MRRAPQAARRGAGRGARRVLFVHSSSGRYGADRQLALIATGLDRRRYVPLVVVPEEGPLCEDLRRAQIEVLVRDLAVVRRELLSARGLLALGRAGAGDAAGLARLVRARGVALVHSNTSVILGGALAAATARVPHVWHVREIYAGFDRVWPGYRAALERARQLVCVSEATRARFTARAPARVIHDGLAIDPRRAERGAARRALGLDGGEPVIAVLGRISDWKGQDVLVRALAEPALRERRAVGVLAGEAWPGAEHRRDAVLAEAERVGVRDRLRLVGFRDDVENVYGAADLIAVPSTAPDPLPNAAIEAAAAGCAVIASAHGGLPEIIRDGETGRLVAPGDAAALAGAAATLLDDPATREQLGQAARLDVRRRFAPERLLHDLQMLYDELLRA